MNAETAAPAPPRAAAREPGRLRLVWRRARGSDVVDAAVIFLVGCLLIAVGLIDVAPGIEVWGAEPPGWLRYVTLAMGCCLVAVKRHRPVLTLIGGVALTLIDLSWGGGLAMLLVLWDLLFSATLRSGPRVRSWLWGIAGGTTLVAAVIVGEEARDIRISVYAALQMGAILLVPMWWADNVRQKTELASLERARADGAAKAVELERERAADHARLAESQRSQAVQSERAAMARDLHDVIASHLSAIAIHSGATLAAPRDGERDRAALKQVRASAVESLTEMRAMIDLLRADVSRDEIPAPGRVAGVRSLVDAAVAAGSDVTFDVDARLSDADAGAPSSVVPAAVGQAVHRIAQEALTNTRKHAPGEPVTVLLALDEAASLCRLTVTNATALEPAVLDEPALRAGTGLLSMRERAEVLGGSFRAGLEGPGNWVVEAEIPVDRRGQDD